MKIQIQEQGVVAETLIQKHNAKHILNEKINWSSYYIFIRFY